MQKIDTESTNLKKQIIKKEKQKKELVDYKWIFLITVLTFIISLCFSFLSEIIIKNVTLVIGIIIVLLFIFIGILFDMIGVAVASAQEKPFNSMSSRKVLAASKAVYLKKNADKVSSFCNDVIGDICGIISGSAGIFIATTISIKFNINILLINLLVTAIISAITIGGKAIFKSYAINKSEIILYNFAKALTLFSRKKENYGTKRK